MITRGIEPASLHARHATRPACSGSWKRTPSPAATFGQERLISIAWGWTSAAIATTRPKSATRSPVAAEPTTEATTTCPSPTASIAWARSACHSAGGRDGMPKELVIERWGGIVAWSARAATAPPWSASVSGRSRSR